jgi:hypothetical protein
MSTLAGEILPRVPPVRLNAAIYIYNDRCINEDGPAYELRAAFSRSTVEPKTQLQITHFTRDGLAQTWPCSSRSGLQFYLDNLPMFEKGCKIFFWTGSLEAAPRSFNAADSWSRPWEEIVPGCFFVRFFLGMNSEGNPNQKATVLFQNRVLPGDAAATKAQKLANIEAYNVKMNAYMEKYSARLLYVTYWIYSMVGGAECDSPLMNIHLY